MTETQKEISEVCEDIKELLLYKNKMYGDSALCPNRIFSRASGLEQILVRIDDKLNRIQKGAGLVANDEDVILLKKFRVFVLCCELERAAPPVPI